MTRHIEFLKVTASATAAALAISAECAADELEDATSIESTFDIGAGYVNHDNQRFGEYRGLTDSGAYGLLDIDFLKRDDGSGSWWSIYGRDLGLDSRELLVQYDRQGHWGGFFEYSQIPREFPLTLTTGLAGIGTDEQQINGTALRDVTLDTERQRYTLGFDVGLPAEMSIEVKFRNEDKEGTRLFGRGTGQLLVEPIDSRTQQIEATLNYSGKKLQLSGGYYGTDYQNDFAVIDVFDGVDISLPPDNQSHQLYLAGGYSFTPTTRTHFKVSYGRIEQNEDFYTDTTFPTNTQESLEGEIETTAAQLGLSSRLGDAVSLLANFRYEDRDDKTPRFQYIDASSSRDGFNTPFSRETLGGKLEATWYAPAGFSFTGSVDYDERNRSVLSLRQVSWREENDELSYRFEVRRSLSETLNGAASYVYADRGGSDYLPANNNTTADYIDPIHFADRKREKLRLSLDWTPLEALSMQVLADYAKDEYDGRALGPDVGRANLYSFDLTYTISEAWQLNAWISQDETEVEQITITGANGTAVPAQNWAADLTYTGLAYGLGLRGKVGERAEIGLDVTLQDDETEYAVIPTLPTPADMLPDISNKQSIFEAFARFQLSNRLSVMAEAEYAQYETDDWTWLNWVYADTSTAFLDPYESTVFYGLSFTYTLR